MAPRTSARSERLFCWLSVIEGNMCSQGYAWGRTETAATSGVVKPQSPDSAAWRRIDLAQLQLILQAP
jgi:hypothetical protein